MKTAEDFKKQAEKLNITFWKIHSCSFCGYDCGYIIKYDTVIPQVYYDNGCDCTWKPASLRNWEDLASQYNLQDNEKVIKEMNKFWGFK